MKKLLWLVPALALFAAGCSQKPALTGVPEAVKILKKSGITVRSTWKKDFVKTGVVLSGSTYKVLDAVPAYYKIRTVNGKEGWIFAGFDEAWTARTADGGVTVLREGGVSIKASAYDLKGPAIGVAAKDYSFPVLASEYFYFKVQTPDGKQGWIYAGKPGDRWVEPAALSVETPADGQPQDAPADSPAESSTNAD